MQVMGCKTKQRPWFLVPEVGTGVKTFRWNSYISVRAYIGAVVVSNCSLFTTFIRLKLISFRVGIALASYWYKWVLKQELAFLDYSPKIVLSCLRC